MTGRQSSRRRSKTQRLIDSEEQETPNASAPRSSKRSNRSETPSSRLSTPASSRATSRSPTPTKSTRRKSVTSSGPARASSRVKKTSKAVNGRSGSATPLSRASRSSSVSSRKAVAKASPKIKAKLGRGYNPNLVNYKESEYHYGSDFDESEEEMVLESDKEEKETDSSAEESDSSENSDELVESDLEWNETIAHSKSALEGRSTTPIPFWLKTEDEEIIPELKLPKSSEDLLVDSDLAFKACGVYEILRHYYLLLRLSLFRFEDFCAALASEEQSNLLSEIHIALLKAIVRAEEKDSTQFGPMDHKDSINALFYFVDCITWPEALRQYLKSDTVINAEPLSILEEYPEYPVMPKQEPKVNNDGPAIEPNTVAKNFIEARINLLSFLADQFLTTSGVRDDITNEGALATEDHCRVCHRLGDMVVCEMCNGVYHLACLDPPLEDVPEYDWQCYICQAHQIDGVIDCIDDQEKSGTKIRHQALGFDRAGNKYWFICRRIFVEEHNTNQIRYYTSVPQFEELMESLDSRYFESELCQVIESERPEIERQMAITEKLTNEMKANSKKSYLELENQTIVKAQEERQEQQLQEERERRDAAEAINRQVREAEDAKRKAEEDELKRKEEEKRREREERLRKREENRGDSFPDANMLDEDMEIKEEEVPMETTEEVITTSSGDANSEVKDEIKEEPEEEKPLSNKQTIIVKPPPNAVIPPEMPQRMTRRTLQEISQGTLYFKLGQEGTFRQYINQFTSNPSALSKVQATEERTKRTHMSHKFSLTEVSTFRWMGQLYGKRDMLVNTLRQTMLQLESNVPLIFMHANWQLMRKAWIQALNTSGTPREFARALTVLQCCLKPSVMLNVWYDSLGHTQLKKITQQMKDDKKKIEKRERKEAEEEAERLRPYMTFVKYTLGLKHQVSKQRGEEYRAHGQYGWLWLSSCRRFTPQDARTMGLRAGPHRLAVKYTDTRNDSFKIVLMEPKAFQYLLKKQEDMDSEKAASDDKDNGTNENSKSEEKSDSETDSKIGIEKKKLEQALKHARLESQVPTSDMFKEVVDVSAALSNQTRVLYPRVAKKASCLDDFLARRIQLKTLEEKRIELKLGKINHVQPDSKTPVVANDKTEGTKKLEEDSDTKTSITSDLAEKPSAVEKEQDCKKFVEQSKKAIWGYIAKLKEEAKNIPVPLSNQECYSPACRSHGIPGACYSAICPNRKQINSLVKVISFQVRDMVSDAEKFGLDLGSVSLAPDETVANSITILQNVISTLMKTKDEAGNLEAIGMSTVTTSTVSTTTTKTVTQVNGEVTSTASVTATTTSVSNSKSLSDGTSITSETSQTTVSATSSDGKVEANLEASKKEAVINAKLGEHNITRIYSSSDASGKLYLKRIQTVAESKKQSKIIRYPLAPSFYCQTRRKRNILNLAKHDVKHLARKAGTVACEGFNYGSKSNNLVWPYPCPRPTFKTSWLYKTACLNSIQTVATQLRTLWACIRWDDMQTKPTSLDGKHQETTETAIITTEIIKHRHTGRFQEITEYFQRKVTIPLDVPKTKTEFTPIRSGLRKRKREEAPVQTEPEVKEDWIPEEKLELWEIRAYRERLERDRNAAVTRTRTGVQLREPSRYEPPTTVPQNKPKAEENTVKIQHAPPGGRSVLTSNANALSQQQTITPPTIIRRIQNPDGSVSILRTTMPTRPTVAQTSTPQQQVIQPGTRKVFISKDGKIIGAQLVQGQQVVNSPSNTNKISLPSVAGGAQNPVATPTMVASPQQQAQPVTPSPQQKVQIVRSADGKIQVRGLLPGQQLVQMPDGKLQIFSQPNATQQQQQAQPQQVQPQQQPAAQQPQQQIIATPATPNQGNRIVVHPSGATSNVGTPQLVSNNSSPATKVATPTKSIVATPLAPGQQIPPGTTVFMSGGKTYCIPKASMTMATQQQVQQPSITTQAASQPTTPSAVTPTLPVNPVPQQQLANVQPQQQPQPQTQQQQQPTSTIGTVQTQSPSGQKQMVEVKSLGQNTVTLKGNQMIVSGPDIAQAQLIAKQLSSGAARLATLNGKQVLISTSPTVVNQQQQQQQAQPQPQQQQVVQPQQPAVVPQQQVVQQPQQQQPVTATPLKTDILNNVKLPSEPLPPNAIKKDEEPKPAAPAAGPQVTAQLVQTAQGPRIVLQGIQGANLTKEQLLSIQQQVKEQLLKAQAEAKQQGKVPPTKIAIQLPSNISNAVLPSTPSTAATSTSPAAPASATPAAATAATSSPATPAATPSVNTVAPATPIASNAATPVRQQQIITTASGQKVILMTNPGQKQVIQVPQNTNMTPVANLPTSTATVVSTGATETPKTTQSLLMTSLTSPQKVQTLKSPATAAAAGNQDKFEVTQEYIQQQIQNALKKDNLSPELEQKLQASLQQYSDSTSSGNRTVFKKKTEEIDPATGEPMDEEWDGASYAERSIANKQRRKRHEENVISERIDRNVGRSGPATPSAAAMARTMTKSPNNVANDEKKKQLIQQKLQTMLLSQKEQLKRSIRQKRNTQEREITAEIKEEIEKMQVKTVTLTAGQPPPTVVKEVVPNSTSIPEPVVDASPPANLLQNSYEAIASGGGVAAPVAASDLLNNEVNNKRKRHESDDTSESSGTPQPPKSKKKRRSSGQATVKKDKLYCICRTKYDPKKFYVGCDVCNNWFHGSCVGITEAMSKTMTEYICDECRNARENHEIYCICQQPYDDTQFYIGCEKCSDWFHGRCVGILQSEADKIDEYLCPRCAPDSKLNKPNHKALSVDDYEVIKKLVKSLWANRNSIPFHNPVNADDVPNYYKVIKEPMDLGSIDKKVNNGEYTKLCEFVGDVMRIFENCRFFNQPNSSIMKSAEGLESFFSSKLEQLRQRVASG